MDRAFWEDVAATGHPLPAEPPLVELTADLTRMLGDADPHLRDEIANATLAAWVSAGVYDDLLEGLGDGMATGLLVGLGEHATDTVFRRSYSVRVLGECVERATTPGSHVVTDDVVLRWGEQVTSWLLRERDLRGYVPGKGWAYALAYGADALGALAASAALGSDELTVLLQVLADRLLLPTELRWAHAEDDRFATAAMRVLRRDVLDVETLEEWLVRIADGAGASDAGAPHPVAGNAQAFLRALHLQLALGPHPPACRSDVLLVLIEQLRRTNALRGGV